MNILLIFFAFPIAIIIISAILQKLLNSPLTVAALTFAIFIVIAFAYFDETFLIAVLAYTILAFIIALLVSKIYDENNNLNNCICNTLNQALQNNNDLNNEEELPHNLFSKTLENNNISSSNYEDKSFLGNTYGCARKYRRY